MGVGKSTIGRALAKKLKMNFIDIDKVIEKGESMTIDEIFKKKGENYFRNLEENTTLRELNKKESVIALGGGAFINHKIRSEILKTCVSF